MIAASLGDPGVEDPVDLVGTGSKVAMRRAETSNSTGSGGREAPTGIVLSMGSPRTGQISNSRLCPSLRVTAVSPSGNPSITSAIPPKRHSRSGDSGARRGFFRCAGPKHEHGQPRAQDQAYRKPPPAGSRARWLRGIAGILDDFGHRHHVATVRRERGIRGPFPGD